MRLRIALVLFSLVVPIYSFAAIWAHTPKPGTASPTPLEACSKLPQFYAVYFYGEVYASNNPNNFICTVYLWRENKYGQYAVSRMSRGCAAGELYSPASGGCVNLSSPVKEKMKGEATSLTCASSKSTLSPSAGLIGNLFFEESLLGQEGNSQIEFSLFYNGIDRRWSHKYSSRLLSSNGVASLIRDDGRVIYFEKSSGLWISENGGDGELLSNSTGWTYSSSDGEKSSYDSNGYLISVSAPGKPDAKIIYSGNDIRIIDDFGVELIIHRDGFQHLVSVERNGAAIAFTYNSKSQVNKTSRSYAGSVNSATYLYESVDFPGALTGVIDEAAERYAKCSYDIQGRVTYSERANGAEKVTLAYNTDGSTTVTNEYGKKATYRFHLIQGVKQIVAIEGAPTPNCPNSNSTFTYDPRGLLKTKTDNQGHLTTYEYNDRGLEVSRTEAAGTPQARTITTQWHPTLFLKTQITEPSRVIRYQYDEQGRRIGLVGSSL